MKNAIVLCLFAILLVSCSSGGGTGNPEELTLVGEWVLSDARFEDETSVDAVVAAEIFSELSGQDCYLFGFTFSENGGGWYESRLESLEVVADLGNFEVDCPTALFQEDFNWSLEGDLLTITFAGEEPETVTIELFANTFTVAGDQIDPELFGGSTAIFIRR